MSCHLYRLFDNFLIVKVLQYICLQHVDNLINTSETDPPIPPGKFQLTQWSDRVSTHTTASFTGSTIGTLPAESLCESIDSAIGCDQSNWGYQVCTYHYGN